MRRTPGASTDNKYRVETRDQICPLLAGLNRMGCRGPHCQWWIPGEDTETGDCAVVYVALSMQPGDAVLSRIRAKQAVADEFHSGLQTSAERIGEHGRIRLSTLIGERDNGVEERAPEPEPLDPAEKLAATKPGIGLAEVEALWGEPVEVSDQNGTMLRKYRIPGGKHLQLVFENGTVKQVLRW